MRAKIHDKVVELLLDSMTQKSGDGLKASFFFGEPGAPEWEKRMGVDLYYRRKKFVRAALYVRQNGPTYLRYLSISDIWSMLQSFVRENYWYLADDTFLTNFEGSYARQVSPKAKRKFADALSKSEIFQPVDRLTLFPLVPLKVTHDFDSNVFFVVGAASLKTITLHPNIQLKHIISERFPPLSEWTGRTGSPNAWLGVRSPADRASYKMKAAILGALALTPLPRYRHLFSGRTMFGGHCTIGDRVTTSFGEAHTPPLMYDITVSDQDHAWLNSLASKLTENERSIRRQIKSLEYFYRAWELEPSERFPVLCMTLDAIFGEANNASQAVIDGVRSVLGSHICEARLRRLMDLRASVIHGGAPDVYDSRKYGRYYDEYEADPIHDLELVVASCLRLKIFDNSLKEHLDPNDKIIKEAQDNGILPKNLSRGTILEDGPIKQIP